MKDERRDGSREWGRLNGQVVEGGRVMVVVAGSKVGTGMMEELTYNLNKYSVKICKHIVHAHCFNSF